MHIISESDSINVEGANPDDSIGPLIDIDSLPRANRKIISSETETLELELIETTDIGCDIYVILNRETEKFKLESIPSNYEIRYTYGRNNPIVKVTTNVVNHYNQLSNDEFECLTVSELKEIEPSSVSKEFFYEVILKDPSQMN